MLPLHPALVFLRGITLLAAALGGSVLGLAAEAAQAEVVDVGGRRELFVDRELIDRMQGLELRLTEPRPAGTALKFDRPWEGIVSGYVTVLRDGDRFLMYYRGRPSTSRGDASAEAHEVTCVAGSHDGVHWSRPNLRLHEVAGTRENNVILVEPKTVTHNFVPFLDGRPGVPAAERFKAVGGTGAGGLFGYASADGFRWRPVSERPLITKGQFDSQNVAFWSEHERLYLCYFRTSRAGVRWVARATSTDFVNWIEPVEMEFGDAPPEHIYINQTQPYVRAPHLYLGLAARFNPGRRALTDEQVRALDLENPRNYAELRNDDSDAVLLTSRGGNQYRRTFLESWVRPGPDLRNWVARANYPALGILQTAEQELSVFVLRNYGQPTIHLERLTLRPDGFASVHGGYAGGDLWTRPVRFAGEELEVNFATSAAGSLRVELLDAEGGVLPGFGLAEAEEMIGDSLARTVRWKGGASVAAWAGQPVRLRFALKDGDLYSYRFRPRSGARGLASEAGGTGPNPGSTRPTFVTVCRDGGAGAYEAFPDVCRLADNRLMCVFYASYTHVGVPNAAWPKGGRIAMCFSSDEGRTWTAPETLYDSDDDDRDPSITQLLDGRLLCSFFNRAGAQVIEATDPAGPWSAPRLLGAGLGVSSPVRELSDGTLVVGGYFESNNVARGLTFRSASGGRTWQPAVEIDNGGQYLDAETDVVELGDGTLLAALRGGRGAPLNAARSRDQGRSWGKAVPLGFVGHCPYLHRTRDGALVLAYRQPVKGEAAYGTALRVSQDGGQTWGDAQGVDPVIGAYPSLVNLRDGSVLLVYYEEGDGSNIRARRFRVEGGQVIWMEF